MNSANCASKSLLVASTLLGAYALPVLYRDWLGHGCIGRDHPHPFDGFLQHDPTGMRGVLAAIASLVALLGLMTGCVDVHTHRSLSRRATGHMLLALLGAAVVAVCYVSRRATVLSSECTGEVETLQATFKQLAVGTLEGSSATVVMGSVSWENVMAFDPELKAHCLRSIEGVRHLTISSILIAAFMMGMLVIHLHGTVDDDDDDVYDTAEFHFTPVATEEDHAPVEGHPIDPVTPREKTFDEECYAYNEQQAVQAVVIVA